MFFLFRQSELSIKESELSQLSQQVHVRAAKINSIDALVREAQEKVDISF